MNEKIDQDHLSCGKCSKQASHQYGQFWWHNDDDPSDTVDFQFFKFSCIYGIEYGLKSYIFLVFGAF